MVRLPAIRIFQGRNRAPVRLHPPHLLRIIHSINKLSTERRTRIIQLLVEGMSMRAVSRIDGCSIDTVAKLLVDAGSACAAYHDQHVVNRAKTHRVECDEIWAFVYAKEANVRRAKAAPKGAGDAWTWTAIDADNKLIISYFVSEHRDAQSALAFMDDLAKRTPNGCKSARTA